MDVPGYADPSFRRAAGAFWHPGGSALTKRGLALCGFAAGEAVLDVGCGSGGTLRMLLDAGLDAVGLDRERHFQEGLPFLQGDASAIDMDEGSLDGIVCECVLSLLPDQDKALAGFARLLRTGGRLLLTDVYLTGEERQTAPEEHASCLQGARSLAVTDSGLRAAGMHVTAFEDHPEALREMAARLVWYGDVPVSSFCTSGGRRYGYGLWVACKIGRDEDALQQTQKEA
jgi:SAM-dependent methyltransferase